MFTIWYGLILTLNYKPWLNVSLNASDININIDAAIDTKLYNKYKETELSLQRTINITAAPKKDLDINTAIAWSYKEL